MNEIGRDVGLEILEGLRELRRGECSVLEIDCRYSAAGSRGWQGA